MEVMEGGVPRKQAFQQVEQEFAAQRWVGGWDWRRLPCVFCWVACQAALCLDSPCKVGRGLHEVRHLVIFEDSGLLTKRGFWK